MTVAHTETVARKTDSLLAHCLARALAEGDSTALWPSVKAAHKASRVASFVAWWADALMREADGSLGIEEFARLGYTSRASAYRRQVEFRELWPEYETPTELARLLIAAMQRAGEGAPSPSLAVAA